jgi:hypothetical protein
MDLNIPLSCPNEIPDLNLTFNVEDNRPSNGDFNFDLNQHSDNIPNQHAESVESEREVEIHEDQPFDFYPIDSETNDGFEQEFEQPNQHVEYVESEAGLNSNGMSYRLSLFVFC